MYLFSISVSLLLLFDKSDTPRLLSPVVSKVHYQELQRKKQMQELPESPDKAPGNAEGTWGPCPSRGDIIRALSLPVPSVRTLAT